MTYADRLRQALAFARKSQTELAKDIGVKPQAIQYLCSQGKGSTHSHKIAAACGVNPVWLTDGKGEMTGYNPAAQLAPQNAVTEIPVLDKFTAIRWKRMGRLFDLDDYKGQTEFVKGAPSSKAFGYVMPDDKMMNQTADAIPQGAVLTVEPDITPLDGDLVAVTNGTEVLIKELVYDGDNRYLRSYNPQYQPIAMDERYEVLGVITQFSLTRKTLKR